MFSSFISVLQGPVETDEDGPDVVDKVLAFGKVVSTEESVVLVHLAGYMSRVGRGACRMGARPVQRPAGMDFDSLSGLACS